MIQNINSTTQLLPIPTLAPSPLNAPCPKVPDSLPIQDKLLLRVAPKGAIPATIGLLAATGTQVADKALCQLNCCPTEENFRDSQAGFRVAIRKFGVPELHNIEKYIQQKMVNELYLLICTMRQENQLIKVGTEPQHLQN